ncbi:shikimate dehydrogenase [Tenacibaculum sp. MAR_2009_124]|uniref:shikimate dehydrogenase family protein n=1 Tax=Tenacibaculum sp. MAR_2009_124 TaxID=1250059 RepID=UPI00089658B7|nr:shikimate dehydrogenase [Tenacibaculum sp. MAR_2009_124]SEB75774.1 shikimate dehydrogenase [Tenacibaculum sp. MAR_2009_124]
MEEKGTKKLFALIGKDISYSFSRGYFADKFSNLKLDDHNYVNFDLQSLKELTNRILENKEILKGMNVTIPYKLEIFDFLDKVDPQAKKIGAVNTIRIEKNGRLIGFNTDVFGFQKSLEPLLKKHHKHALILGTGGASKAVAYALEILKIEFSFVSRNKNGDFLTYDELNTELLSKYFLIVNCTPLGTHPNIERAPKIPYSCINEKHLLYDLIYNPSETTFLKKGKEQGAAIKNGLEMLELQAEKAWEIWNK